jgi:hypothetical protein
MALPNASDVCAAIEQKLVTESGRIGPDIYRRTLNTSAWLKLIKQEPWPEEMGDTVSVLTYERSLPASPMTWSDVGQSANTANGTCVPQAQIVPFAQTLRQYNLQQGALESPRICVNDLRVAFKRKEQLANMMSVLTENSAYTWIERYRDEFTRLATHKMIVAPGLPEGTASFPLTLPTSLLTQGVLKNLYLRLIRDGAGANPLDRENARPVFGLITDSQTSEDIIKRNSDIRTDFHYSARSNELLAPLGVERSYNGFFHLIDDFGPRYDFVSGAWVRRYPYTGSAATKGTKQEIDPLYTNAAYMDSFIFHQDVYRSLVPAPITSAGGSTKFDAVSYRGDFRWRNIPDEVCNPDGNIGYFRGIFANGSKPIFPFFGYVLRHLRCDAPLEFVACS